MNMSDLNNKIYGNIDLKQGEYADAILKSLEQKQMNKFNNISDNNFNNKFNGINKEIKF